MCGVSNELVYVKKCSDLAINIFYACVARRFMISSMPVQFVQSEEIELWLMYFSALSSIEKKSYGTRAGKIGKNTRQIQMQQSPS